MPSTEFPAHLLASAGWRKLPEHQVLNGLGMSPEHLLHRELLSPGILCTAEISQQCHSAPHLNIRGKFKQEQSLKGRGCKSSLHWQCLHEVLGFIFIYIWNNISNQFSAKTAVCTCLYLPTMHSGGKVVHQVFQSSLERLSKPFEGSRRVLHNLKKARETNKKKLWSL